MERSEEIVGRKKNDGQRKIDRRKRLCVLRTNVSDWTFEYRRSCKTWASPKRSQYRLTFQSKPRDTRQGEKHLDEAAACRTRNPAIALSQSEEIHDWRFSYSPNDKRL